MAKNSFLLSLSQAAKETGKSKSVISNSIKSGKLSASKNDSGSYDIDPAELFRVFPKNGENAVLNEQKERNRTPEKNGENALIIKELELELKFLGKEKSALESQLVKKDEELSEWKKHTDDWKSQAQKLLLTHDKPETPAEAPPEAKQDSPVLWAILGASVFVLFLVVAINFYPEIMRLLGR